VKTYQLAVAACFMVFALAVVHAQAPSSESEATLTANPVYTKNCAKCHGKTAEGRHFAGPSLTSAKAAAMSADDLRNMIANGKGRMPKFAAKLKPDEIDTLVRQIQALNKKYRAMDSEWRSPANLGRVPVPFAGAGVPCAEFAHRPFGKYHLQS
jgi:mono/diheme cytochrome c family protein